MRVKSEDGDRQVEESGWGLRIDTLSGWRWVV